MGPIGNQWQNNPSIKLVRNRFWTVIFKFDLHYESAINRRISLNLVEKKKGDNGLFITLVPKVL